MLNIHIQEAAKFLFEHRLKKSNINNLPKHITPKTKNEAYLIQEELKLLYLNLKENISIGKKVGCTSLDAQKQLDINEPFYGNLFSRFYSIEPTKLSSKKFSKPFIEPEIALRVKADIDISKAPFSINNIDDLFIKIENNSYSDTGNIFSSKEEFINYAKDVINSTFKVTKFDQKKKIEDIENLEPMKKTLLLVKESLLINNINQAIKVLEESDIDDINLNSWLVEAKNLAEANSNFYKFKIKILNLME